MAIHVLKEIPGSLTWLDVNEPTRAEIDTLSTRYGLNAYTLADSLEPDHLPKHELLGDIHFIIVRTVTGETSPHADSVQEMTDKLAIFYSSGFLITIHRSDQPFLATLASENDAPTTGGMVTRILEMVLDTYESPAVSLAGQVDALERRIFLRDHGANMHEALYYIRRKASVCHKILLMSEAAINAVRFSDPVALQDVKDQHVKLVHIYGQVNDDLTNLLNIYLSMSAQRTGDVMKVLTVFSVFFMPLTFIAGIYGMNFRHMPELATEWGYPAALVLMALTTVAIYVWFRRRKWI